MIAHSNVGVKNIALSLFKRQRKTGREINSKIIVSKDFHFDWCGLSLGVGGDLGLPGAFLFL